MQRSGHHAIRGFEIALRDMHCSFVMQAQQHLRRAITEKIHQAVVQAAVTRSRIQCDVRNIEFAQHCGDGVTAPVGFRFTGGHRAVVNDGGVRIGFSAHQQYSSRNVLKRLDACVTDSAISPPVRRNA